MGLLCLISRQKKTKKIACQVTVFYSISSSSTSLQSLLVRCKIQGKVLHGFHSSELLAIRFSSLQVSSAIARAHLQHARIILFSLFIHSRFLIQICPVKVNIWCIGLLFNGTVDIAQCALDICRIMQKNRLDLALNVINIIKINKVILYLSSWS